MAAARERDLRGQRRSRRGLASHVRSSQTRNAAIRTGIVVRTPVPSLSASPDIRSALRLACRHHATSSGRHAKASDGTRNQEARFEKFGSAGFDNHVASCDRTPRAALRSLRRHALAVKCSQPFSRPTASQLDLRIPARRQRASYRFCFGKIRSYVPHLQNLGSILFGAMGSSKSPAASSQRRRLSSFRCARDRDSSTSLRRHLNNKTAAPCCERVAPRLIKRESSSSLPFEASLLIASKL